MPDLYLNSNDQGTIRDLRFAEQNGETLAFLRLFPGKQFPAAEITGLGLTVVSDVADGASRLIVARTPFNATETLQRLASYGETLTPPQPAPAKFNAWKWRGITSFIGQGLQMVSSIWTDDRDEHGRVIAGDKSAIFGFAALNLVANVSNIIFGSQKREDKHQLHMLESRVNDIARESGAAGALPDPKEKTVKLHREEDPHRSFTQKSYDILQKISVTGGEIGLRTIGSASLSFPTKHWMDGWRTLRSTGSLPKTFDAMKNRTQSTFLVGLLMLTGKFVSLLSKEPDPYNPEPQTWWGKIREKVTFRASSIIEGGAATYMMQDRYRNHHVKMFGQRMRDFPGAVGNAVFIGGYGIRLGAQYGTLEVKMRELYAHTADALAQVPHDKIPETLARTTLMLDQHFGDASVGVDKLYTELATRLKSYHNIDVLKPVQTPEKPADTAPVIADKPDPKLQQIAAHAALKEPPVLERT